MIKGPIQEEDITFININAPNTGALKYIKQILKDLKIGSNTIIMGDFNTWLISVDKWIRQKIRKETLALNDIRLLGLNRYL